MVHHWLPAHQVQMRVQNSGSDQTIGPMALNSVFQYYTQNTDLGFIPRQKS